MPAAVSKCIATRASGIMYNANKYGMCQALFAKAQVDSSTTTAVVENVPWVGGLASVGLEHVLKQERT